MALYSILIVDDCEEDRYLLKRQLEEAFLTDQVFEAEDGQMALDFLSNYEENSKQFVGKFPPIIIFLDINMPIMGGHEFLENFANLRKKQNFQSTVLMMFTSSIDEEDHQKALIYDFVKGYLLKMPRSPDDLKNTILQNLADLDVLPKKKSAS